ncbi:HNH endonuclease [Streptomyces sp. NPDC057298]|uniref:HNH endonuclease n=1 Tax=Streptomyces sp. NPDC057298 TaxID=3346091 RepID=UPI00363F0AA7
MQALRERRVPRHYAADGRAIRARGHARRRSVDPLPVIAADHLLEQFEGTCAHCPAPATTWDHVRPVRDGGQTAPGNVVPACATCNSSKKATDVFTWLDATGRTRSPALFDVLALEMLTPTSTTPSRSWRPRSAGREPRISRAAARPQPDPSDARLTKEEARTPDAYRGYGPSLRSGPAQSPSPHLHCPWLCVAERES